MHVRLIGVKPLPCLLHPDTLQRRLTESKGIRSISNNFYNCLTKIMRGDIILNGRLFKVLTKIPIRPRLAVKSKHLDLYKYRKKAKHSGKLQHTNLLYSFSMSFLLTIRLYFYCSPTCKHEIILFRISFDSWVARLHGQ